MTIDITAFKLAFPEWGNCTDESLQFWVDLSECLVCLPAGCPALARSLPFLVLAHVLTLNGITCAEAGNVPAPDACECDDDALTQLLGSGARLSSASIDGLAVSFDNGGINSLAVSIGGGSPFRAWLAQTKHGQMVAAILSRANKGPVMAIGHRGGTGSVYGDDHVLGHGHVPGHL